MEHDDLQALPRPVKGCPQAMRHAGSAKGQLPSATRASRSRHAALANTRTLFNELVVGQAYGAPEHGPFPGAAPVAGQTHVLELGMVP